MLGFLASIKDLDEAKVVSKAPIDILDLKNIHDGPMGFVGKEMIKSIRRILPYHVLSATMGNDQKPDTTTTRENLEFVIIHKINYLKIGLFDANNIKDHKSLLCSIDFNITKKICVMFADLDFNLDVVNKLIDIGYDGVMIDTSYKNGKSLLDNLKIGILKDFVHIVKSNNKIAGLAGSLRIDDIPILKKINPNFLGFRGQLCSKKETRQDIDLNLINKVSRIINSSL